MTEEGQRLIVSHIAKPAHIDDVVATALLLHNNPGYQPIRFPHNSEQMAQAMEIGSIMVDCGRQYNPGKGLFDHHQDASLECSALLVANHLGYEQFSQSMAGIFMSDKDVFGLKSALSKHKHQAQGFPRFDANKPMNGVFIPEEIKINRLGADMTAKLAAVIEYNVASLKYNDLYSHFVRSIWREIPYELKEKEAQMAVSARFEESEALRTAEVIYIAGLKVVISHRPVEAHIFFSGLQADILVSSSAMNPDHTSFIRGSIDRLESVNLSRMAEILGVPSVFNHASGHLSVLKSKLEHLDYAQMVDGLSTVINHGINYGANQDGRLTVDRINARLNLNSLVALDNGYNRLNSLSPQTRRPEEKHTTQVIGKALRSL